MVTTRAFFYGLYMDPALLADMGYEPEQVGAARLDGFELRIGERATLEPATGAAVYGFLHDLPVEQLAALYARPEVSGYVPITVAAVLLADESVHRASCYVLETGLSGGAVNVAYAAKLATLVQRLGLPANYAAAIEGMAGRG